MTSSSLRPPQSEPRPEPQTTNSVQVTEPCNEDMDLEANEVDSFDKHIDRMFATSSAEKRKGRKTTEFWDGDLIDFDGIVKQAKMSVQEAMEWSLNGSKIVLRLNEELQAVGDGAGLLSGILGELGSDYSKFPICEKIGQRRCSTFRQIVTVESRKYFCNKWGGPRRIQGGSCMTRITNQQGNLSRILINARREFLERIRGGSLIIAKCKQNALNQKKQLYTHTGNSKSLARAREEEEKISEIEQLDETTRILSENDSLSQALNKEHSVRVRGIGIGPTLSQLFRLSSQPSVDRAQIEEAQRMLCELQAEVMAEKLKRKAMEDEVAAEEMNRQAIESVLSYLVQQQGGELPPDIVARMNSLDGHDGK
ncbi:hypothetical protein Ahy_A07g036040 [Arachis hypogaea]|uniref:Uncharacterized protein n=1 Tax=Arachis hypogaea TaxID=3818 RepID=A0A445CF27_ARAHY|nr:hypothetical protein Ahy_A07g036040 [Arachis hypogaea]